MNCTAARKLLYAFADGQLGVKDNCEVLDHLKMCPECSRVVHDHQTLRDALRKNLSRDSLSGECRTRILATLGHREHAHEVARTAVRRFRPYALAAGFLLVASAVLWISLFGAGGVLHTKAAGDAFAVNVPRGTSAATAIAKVHNVCCAHGPAHHRKDLPTELAELTPVVAAHYSQKIATLAPDLAKHGYRFESANYCGVRDKPGCDGCHLIYVNSQGTPRRLSLFSVPRWDCLDKCDTKAKPGVDGLRHYQVDQDDGGTLAILAWHNDATTYICCAREPFGLLRAIVGEVRTAMTRLDAETLLAALAPSR
jgi:hypothetical protein